VANALGTELDDVQWATGTIDGRQLLSTSPETVDLVVLSPELAEREALELADWIRSAAPATGVVLVRAQHLNGSLSAAMRAGVRDVVDLSAEGDDLGDALRRALDWSSRLRAGRDAGPRQPGMVVSVFSSKGGTGKTFLACNLAVALASASGKDTALVDLDLEIGDVFSSFGKEPTRSLHDVVAAAKGRDWDALMGAATPLAQKVWGIGAPPDPTGQRISGQAAQDLLSGLRDKFPFVVVDSPADYSDHALAAFDLSDAICLIAALDVVGVKHLVKAMETLLSIGIPADRLRVVLNRADSKVGLEARDVERVVAVKADAQIPSSRSVPASLNNARPVVLDDPKSDVAKSIESFAQKLLSTAPAGQLVRSDKGVKRRRPRWVRS
jgi:pilus assembly protein CpaE